VLGYFVLFKTRRAAWGEPIVQLNECLEQTAVLVVNA